MKLAWIMAGALLGSGCASLSGGARSTFAATYACPVDDVTILAERRIRGRYSVEGASFDVAGCGRRAIIGCEHPAVVTASGEQSLDTMHTRCWAVRP
jgi:hypothetical protein